MASTVIYAIDIGDSQLRSGVFVDGVTTHVESRFTPVARGERSAEQVLFETVGDMIDVVASRFEPMDALAVSASGIMTLQPRPGARRYGPFKDHELFVLAPNVDGLKYVPIVSRLEELGYGVRVHVENDCNAALRSVVELDDAICVNLGAGVGAAVKRAGKIEHVSGTWSCYEIGHGMRWKLPQEVIRSCNCGGMGCLEAVIGGRALAERYRTNPEDALPDVYEHMRVDVLEFLPLAIADTVKHVGIETVVLSGKAAVGFSESGDFLDELTDRVERIAGTRVKISLMQFGEIAELRGVSLALLDHNLLPFD